MSSEWRNPPGAGQTMRITCPNCDAQYEVDDSLIPEGGRDVQCSNCGKGWFQPKHPVAAEASAESAEAAAQERAAEDREIEAGETEPAGDAAPAEVEDDAPQGGTAEVEEPRPGSAAAALPDEDDDEFEAEPPAPPAAALPPRKTDETVLAVLREEAEREIAQRRQEAGGIESQPDLGLTEPTERRTRSLPAEAAAAGAVVTGARRDALPDIDEINSTLRSDADRGASRRDEAEEKEIGGRRRGFRSGFGLMLLLAAVLIGLYVAAPWLAATVPALEPFLMAYVEMANRFADWIDGLLAAGVDGLSALTGNTASGA